MNPDINELLALAIKAALNAADEILKVYATDFSVVQKADNSPLTSADKNAHKIISHILAASKIPVLSEEGKDVPFSERKNWETLWIVDPLDGTKEFIKRNGEFTVNIALVKNHEPVAGVIYIPVHKILYYGSVNGCFKFVFSEDEKPGRDFSFQKIGEHALPLPLQKNPSKYTIVASRSHITRETDEFIEKMRKKHGEVEIISAGSSLKFCLVAEGKAHVYPRFGPTMEWDTAAGQAIVRCAGKNVIDFETKKPLLYNRANLKNGWFIVE